MGTDSYCRNFSAGLIVGAHYEMGLQSHCRTFNSGDSLLRNLYVLGAGASTQQKTLPTRDIQKRCIAETLVKLSGTSSQRTKTEAKNYRAGTS